MGADEEAGQGAKGDMNEGGGGVLGVDLGNLNSEFDGTAVLGHDLGELLTTGLRVRVLRGEPDVRFRTFRVRLTAHLEISTFLPK